MVVQVGTIVLDSGTARVVKSIKNSLKINLVSLQSVSGSSEDAFIYDDFSRSREIVIEGEIIGANAAYLASFISEVEAVANTAQTASLVFQCDYLANKDVFINGFDWDKNESDGAFVLTYTLTLIEGDG